MQDRIFHAGCLGFILGVLLRSFFFVDSYFVLLVLFLSLFVTIFCYFNKLKWGVVAGIFMLAIALGILRFNAADHGAPEVFEAMLGGRVNLTGEIVEDPDVRETNQQLIVKAALNGEETKILLREDLEQDFKYGDEIKFSGKLEKPESFLTDEGKMFDYLNYLQKDGVFYIVNGSNTEILSRGNGNFIRSALFAIKEKFLNKINSSISPPESLLMAGLILGEKSNFSTDLRENFIKTGTVHIVALSGYNVTIVAEWFMKLFKFLPQNSAIGVGIVLVWLFILMTGGSSTALRAGIMATLVLIARATGRNYDIGRALIIAGVLMIIFNPFLLVYDLSFQLSFIAAVAVIFFSPIMEKYFYFVTKSFGLREIISTTVAAYIFVSPFILYKMATVSLVALPANILILPLIPLTMILGFITGFLGLIWYPLSVPTALTSYLFLHYELSVIDFFSQLPFAAFSIHSFPLFVTTLIYICFVYRIFGRSVKQFFTDSF